MGGIRKPTSNRGSTQKAKSRRIGNKGWNIISASLTLTQAGFPSRIEKVTLVHYLAQGAGPPAWDENEDDYRLIAGGVRWWDEDLPVVYVVNLRGSGLEETNSLGNLDGDEEDELDALEILQLASEEWDDGACSGWGGITVDLFEEDPETTDKSTVGMDGVNLILWSDLDERVIAVIHKAKFLVRQFNQIISHFKLLKYSYMAFANPFPNICIDAIDIYSPYLFLW